MEVEAKFQVDDFSRLKSTLLNLGARQGKKVVEKDIYFTPFNDIESLRVRHTDIGAKVTYKRYDKQAEAQVALELETEAGPKIEDILLAVGHNKVFEKVKTREYFRMGNVTISLDDVVGLGKFVEVEYIGETEKGILEIKKAVKQLGLNWDDRVKSTYTAMLLEKRHKNTVVPK